MDDTSVSRRVVERVADADQTAPTELTPLAACVDPDAVEALFPAPDDPVRELQFVYEGYAVVVQNDGDVSLEPHDQK